MSDLEKLIQLGLLDRDFMDISDLSLVNNESNTEKLHDNDNDDTKSYVPQQPQQPKPREFRTYQTHQHTDDVEETFEHEIQPQRQAFKTHLDNIIDTSDEEDHELSGDIYKYYREVQYHWLYSGLTKPGWWHYPKMDNDRLERKYKNGRAQTKIKVNGHDLIVDFNNMSQISGRSSRNILRIESLKDLYIKGIGGEPITRDQLLQLPAEENFLG